VGRNAQRVQVLFVTIDPERDTGPMLGRYVTAFDPPFIGLRGNDTETDAVATAFHAGLCLNSPALRSAVPPRGTLRDQR